jgi:hypothetical protein
VPTKLDICEVYILIKMTNWILKQLSTYKSKHLELIYFDIAGHFLLLICGNCYFILIFDSYTGVNWIIPLKHKNDAIVLMKIQKVEVELAIGDKIIAVKTDHAPELIKAICKWRSGMRSEVTIIASSHQNVSAE